MVFDRRRRHAERAIDRVKTSEKRGFHEVDGALRRNGACGAAAAPRPPREIAADNFYPGIGVRAILIYDLDLRGQDTNSPISPPVVGARLSRPEPPGRSPSHTKPSTSWKHELPKS